MTQETPDERRRRLNRERSQRWRDRHPGAGAAASQAYRERNPGPRVWPAKNAVGLEVEKLKNQPCTDCGQTFPRVCMDFDHVRGEKLGNVGTMVSHGWSRQKIMDEIAKCELVCANCHRIRTSDRRRS